jgi:hypothetical protein
MYILHQNIPTPQKEKKTNIKRLTFNFKIENNKGIQNHRGLTPQIELPFVLRDALLRKYLNQKSDRTSACDSFFL